MSIHTTISGIELKNCIYNASGCLCTNTNELNNLKESSSGAILSKSSTIEPRMGNPEPRSYFKNNTYSINSMGIPNYGYKFYANYYSQNTQTKPFIQSIYPFSNDDLREIFNYLNKIEFKSPYLLEVNLSCPNIGANYLETGMNKIEEYLDVIKQNNVNNLPVGLKLMPYYLASDFDSVSNIILKNLGTINYITCINSIVNGLEIDINNETTIIKPNGGLGGIGGSSCLPIGLSNIYNFNKRLNCNEHLIDIIGCGGINTGKDVYKYILAGASAVQVGTAFCSEGIKIFDRLSIEFAKLMEKKYSNIEEFRGKLRVIE